MKKIFIWLLLFLIGVNLYGSIPTVQGLKIGMSKQKALKIVEQWHSTYKHYTRDETNISAEIVEGRFKIEKNIEGGLTKYTYIVYTDSLTYTDDELYFDKENKLVGFRINYNTVNRIFNVKDYSIEEFAQAFVDAYNWIDRLEVKSQYLNNPFTGNYQLIKWYESKSLKNGWILKIENNKTILIKSIQKAGKKSFK